MRAVNDDLMDTNMNCIMRNIRLPFWAGLLAVTIFLHATAQAAAAPSAFVTELTNNAFAALRAKDISEAERFSRFRELLSEGVDLQRVGRFVLGPNWRRANPEQQAEYQALFSDYVIAAYAGRLKDYTESKYTISKTLRTGENEYIVKTLFVHPKNPEPVHVDWRLREEGEALKVIDLTIEGISMALTQRSEFSAIIQQNNGDIGALIDRLRNISSDIKAGKEVTVSK